MLDSDVAALYHYQKMKIVSIEEKNMFHLNMESEKVKYLINMINDMDVKDKLRLAICMSQSKWSGLIYNTKENKKSLKNYNGKGDF